MRSQVADIAPLFELLKNAQLISCSGINERRVLHFSAGQLSDIGAQAAALTRAEGQTSEVGAVAHSATLSLGGSAQPCAGLNCRIRRVDQLVTAQPPLPASQSSGRPSPRLAG